MFERFDVLGWVYKMGWTAHKEWVAWRRLGRGRGSGAGVRRGWRRERRRWLVLDRVQATAERRIYEIPKNALNGDPNKILKGE